MRHQVTLAAIVLSTSLLASAQQAPTQPPQQGIIAGRVLDATSGTPIAGAAVTVTFAQPTSATGAAPRARPPVLTDDEGRFVVSGMPAGRADLSAAARGYLTQRFGALRPGGTPQLIDLAQGARIENVVVRLSRPAVVSGRVLDDIGEPVSGVNIGVLRRDTVSGRIRYSAAGADQTDDLGRYRASTLAPGNYIVVMSAPTQTFAASTLDLVTDAQSAGRDEQLSLDRRLRESAPPPIMGAGYRIGEFFLIPPGGGAMLVAPPDADGRLRVAGTTFHPAAYSPTEATVLTLAAGDVRSNIDISTRMAPTVSVSGTVARPDGQAAAHVGVRIAREDVGDLGTWDVFDTGATVTDATGRFSLLGVPRGTYVMRVRVIPAAPVAGPPTEPVLAIKVPLTVGDEPVRDLRINLQEAPRVSGRVVFDGTSMPTAPQIARLAVEVQTVDMRYPATPPAPRSMVGTGGDFRTTGIVPGWYVLRAVGLPGWTVSTALSDGRDISDEPFEAIRDVADVVVTLSDRASELTGVVRRADGAVDPDAVVIIFPADRRHPGVKRRQLVRADKNGGYSMSGLPPGSYTVIAVDERASSDWEEASFLDRASGPGTRITIGPAKTTLDLRTTVLGRDRQ